MDLGKRTITLIICTAMLLLILPFSSCSAPSVYSEGEGDLRIVTSSFVPFDLTREVAKDKATVSVLQTNGADLHSYVPDASALKALTEADVFVYIGGVSDELWAQELIEAAQNPSLTVIKLIDLAECHIAELEGHTHSLLCKSNHTQKLSGSHSHGDGHDHEHDHDEHVWTSIRTVIKAVEKITEICASIDPVNADFYKSSSESYVSELIKLDAQYADAIAGSEKKTLVFADRFPFIYLVADYGLCYYAAFSGCSSEVNASFETHVSLTNAVKKNGLDAVIITEASDGELAAAISRETGCKVLTLDSLQSVGRKGIADGASYIETMRKNLIELKKAL